MGCVCARLVERQRRRRSKRMDFFHFSSIQILRFLLNCGIIRFLSEGENAFSRKRCAKSQIVFLSAAKRNEYSKKSNSRARELLPARCLIQGRINRTHGEWWTQSPPAPSLSLKEDQTRRLWLAGLSARLTAVIMTSVNAQKKKNLITLLQPQKKSNLVAKLNRTKEGKGKE